MSVVWSVATVSIEEGLLYAFMVLGVYISFRILAFPDLTVDGSFPLGAAVAATLIFSGQDPFLSTAIAVVAGLLAGLGTGLLNTKLRINELLAGILMMTALYSINLQVMGRSNMAVLGFETVFERSFRALQLTDKTSGFILITGILAVALVLSLAWFFHTQLGLAVRATGDNEQMIRGLGVDTDVTKLIGLSLANGLVALSGALAAQAQGFADVGMGIGMIVAGLASIILGESLLRFKGVSRCLVAVVIGSIVYRLLITLALRFGFGPTNLKLVTAALVVAALAFPLVQGRLGMSFRRMDARRVKGAGFS